MTTARPFLMFQDGSAQAALDLYCATFPDSRLLRAERYARQLELGVEHAALHVARTVCRRAERALEGSDLPDVAQFFKGPTAVVISRADPVAPAKVLAFAKGRFAQTRYRFPADA